MLGNRVPVIGLVVISALGCAVGCTTGNNNRPIGPVNDGGPDVTNDIANLPDAQGDLAPEDLPPEDRPGDAPVDAGPDVSSDRPSTCTVSHRPMAAAASFRSASGLVCSPAHILNEDGRLVGLASAEHPFFTAVTIGTTNVTDCLAVDFGATFDVSELRVVAQSTGDICGDTCGSVCGSGAELVALGSTDGIDYRLLGRTRVAATLESHVIAATGTVRFALFCKGESGPQSDNIGIDFVEGCDSGTPVAPPPPGDRSCLPRNPTVVGATARSALGASCNIESGSTVDGVSAGLSMGGAGVFQIDEPYHLTTSCMGVDFGDERYAQTLRITARGVGAVCGQGCSDACGTGREMMLFASADGLSFEHVGLVPLTDTLTPIDVAVRGVVRSVLLCRGPSGPMRDNIEIDGVETLCP